MRSTTATLVAFAAALAFVAWACDGKPLLDLGGAAEDAGGHPDGSIEGGASNAINDPESGTDSSGGGGDGGAVGSDGGGAGSSGGGPATDSGVVVVLGNTMPCGTNVCTPPNVCCQRVVTGPATCEQASLCTDSIAHGCTDATCPSGSICCGTGTADAGVSGFTQCQVGTQCSPATAPVCTNGGTPCPAGTFCPVDTAGLALDVCTPSMVGEGGT
jgi:hypothetical protein